MSKLKYTPFPKAEFKPQQDPKSQSCQLMTDRRSEVSLGSIAESCEATCNAQKQQPCSSKSLLLPAETVRAARGNLQQTTVRALGVRPFPVFNPLFYRLDISEEWEK